MRGIVRQAEQYGWQRFAASPEVADHSIQRLLDSGFSHHVDPSKTADLVDEVWREQKADRIPNEGRAAMMGGLAGSGKSFLRKGPHGKQLGLDNYLAIDPDDFKQKMAERGLTPQIPGLSPMESSTFVHQHSVELAEQLAHRAYSQGKNVLWDTTMTDPDALHGRIKDLRDKGYKEVNGVLADAPPEISRARVDERHQQGEDAYARGQGMGGRWLPTTLTNSTPPPSPGSGRHSQSGEIFDSAENHFDNTASFDTSGETPVRGKTTGPRWGQTL